MNYIDGVVIPVATANKELYIEYAQKMAPLFKKHGALKVIDCWGDSVPEGELTSFPKSVQLKADETVVFSWVVWPSKEIREKGWQDMEDELNQLFEKNPMPFDGKRMIYGGFQMIIDE